MEDTIIKLRSLIFGGAAAIIVTGGASAADLYTPLPEAVAPVASYKWTGVYGGIIGGWNDSRARGDWNLLSELQDSPFPNFFIESRGETNFRSSGDGELFGGTIGANLQRGMFVFGVEGDMAWTDNSGRGTDNWTNVVTITGQDLQLRQPGELAHRWNMDWFGTARIRAGVTPVDRLLIFGTVGLAAANVDLNTIASVGVQTLTTSNEETYYGWTAGAGGEFAITSHVRLKADWLYYDLGSQSDLTKSILHVDDLGGGVGANFLISQHTKLDLTGNTFRGGVIVAF